MKRTHVERLGERRQNIGADAEAKWSAPLTQLLRDDDVGTRFDPHPLAPTPTPERCGRRAPTGSAAERLYQNCRRAALPELPLIAWDARSHQWLVTIAVGQPVRGCRSTGDWQADVVITCVVHYVIDPTKSEAFERFARRWMELVNRHGGTHHGYFLPGEGASDAALALFSFPSLTAYERYRARFDVDPDFVAADRIRDESGCVVRYDRTFMRPLLPDD